MNSVRLPLPNLTRGGIDRINKQYQSKENLTPAQVYQQLDDEIIEIIDRIGISYSELHSRSRSQGCSDARSAIAVVAIERLTPLGISEDSIAEYIKMKRTTMLAGRDRWHRDHGEITER